MREESGPGPGSLPEDAAAELRFCLVASRFHREITGRLLDGARRKLQELGAASSQVRVVRVPGAWELPWAARRASRLEFDAVVALGCVIRGDTPHFEYICQGTTRGLMSVASGGETPVTFGLLTCDTREQAEQRAGGTEGNKGAEAARAAVELCGLAEELPW